MAMAAMRPQVRTTKVWVERRFPKGDEFEEKNIEVQVFETQPAEVSCKAGRTINVGNYESVRIDVGVTMPVYPEEVQDGLEQVSSIVGAFLAKEEAQIRAALAGKSNGKKLKDASEVDF